MDYTNKEEVQAFIKKEMETLSLEKIKEVKEKVEDELLTTCEKD